MQKEENFVVGMFYMLFTFLAVAVMGALGKAAIPYTNSTTIVFFQNSISLLVLLPFIFIYGVKKILPTKRIGMHVLRAITGTACWYCLFIAIKLIGLNTAVLLIYTAPLWMPLMGHFLFKEKSAAKVWVGVGMGFIGVALVLNVHSFKVFDNYGVLIGLAGGILLAMALFSVRWLNRTEHYLTIMFYYFLMATILVMPLTYFTFEMNTTSMIVYFYLIGIGVAFAISQFSVVLAYQHASAVKLSPFIYSVIVFTALINWGIWHIVPNTLEATGMILVIVGGLVASIRRVQKSPGSH